MQSRGEIEFVYAEEKQYPLAYLRSDDKEKILVIINPADREVSFDGDYPIKLGFGDKIVIKKAEQATNILKLSKLSFLEILSKKMQTCI